MKSLEFLGTSVLPMSFYIIMLGDNKECNIPLYDMVPKIYP